MYMKDISRRGETIILASEICCPAALVKALAGKLPLFQLSGSSCQLCVVSHLFFYEVSFWR